MATAAFLDGYRSGAGGASTLAHLVKIVAARVDGSQSDSIYLADSDVGTMADVVTGEGAGRYWSAAVLELGPVIFPGDFGSTSVALATSRAVLLASHQVTLVGAGGPTLTQTLRDLARTHVLLGATVSLWRHLKSLTGAGDAQGLGEYTVMALDVEGDKISLQLRQRTGWNRPVAPRYVNRKDYPRTPDETVGLGLPVLYGDLSGPPLRRPWTTQYGANHRYLNMIRNPKRPAAALLVDTGRGAGAAQNPAARVLIAGHQVASVNDPALGSTVYMESGERSLILLDPPGADQFNIATEAGIKLPDQFNYAYSGAIPSETFNPTDGALNPRHIMDPSDSTFAYLDFAQSFKHLEFRFAPRTKLGGSVHYQYLVGYQSSSNLASLGLYLGINPGIDDWALRLSLPASTSPTVAITNTFAFASPTDPWDFFTQYPFRVTFRGGAPAGWAKIFFVGWIIKFAPYEAILVTERFLGNYRTVQREPAPWFGGRKVFAPYRVPVMEPAVTELRGRFWYNAQGTKDDGSGTYTGTASALIERLPDILRHLLVTYGGESAARIETGAATHGSFVAARDILVDGQGAALRYAQAITQSTDVMSVMSSFCASALALPTISPYDNKWKLIPWRVAPPISYPRRFSRWDIVEAMGPKVEMVPISDLMTGVRVAYGYNGFSRGYDSEVALSYNRSVASYEHFGLRDQYMTVVAGVNDRLDFKPGAAAAVAATLTVGDYTVQGWIEHLRARMEVASTDKYLVGAGATFKQFWNDRLSYNDGSADRYVAIPTGPTGTKTYATMAAVATAVQAALNLSVSSVPMVVTSGLNTVQMPNGTTQFARGHQISMIPGFATTVTIISVDSDTQVTASANANASVNGSGSVFATLAAGSWTVAYVVSGNLGKFTIAKSGGSTRTVLAGASPTDLTRYQSGWAALGFGQLAGNIVPATAPSVTTADDDRYVGHLWLFGLTSPVDVLVQSGANGVDSAAPRSCSDLLGARADTDRLREGTHSGLCFDCPKGIREQSLVRTAARYGPRRDVEVEGKAIYAGATAMSLRDRLVDMFGGDPRAAITFNTVMAPDIEHGHVFDFAADMDDFVPYTGIGSDGKWSGRRFIVADFTHHTGPASRDTTIVAVDVTS